MTRWSLPGLTVVLAAAFAVGCSTEPTRPAGSAPHGGDSPSLGRAPASTPVVSALAGDTASPMRIQSDQAGAYVDGVDGVVSILQGSLGDWELDADTRTSRRTLRIDLSEPAPGTTATPPFDVALVKGRIIAKASQLTSGSFAAMRGLGTTIRTPLSVAFTYGGATYAIRMAPTVNFGTDWTTVTCTAVADPSAPDTSACSGWSVIPSAIRDSVPKNVGFLEKVGTKTSTPIGYYLFTFDFAIAK